MVDEDIHTIWKIWGPGGLIEKIGPERAIRELKKRGEAGAIIGWTLYKLLMDKWIDVALRAGSIDIVTKEKTDPGIRGPALDFMLAAGEIELVNKIEALRAQYGDVVPRSVQLDIRDEFNNELQKKVGRRIPLDPKDASKKDIEDSKRIAQQLGVEEVPAVKPVKPEVKKEEPRAELRPEPVRAPLEPIIPVPEKPGRKVPELDLMKKEIEERIARMRAERARGELKAGESTDDRNTKVMEKKISELPRAERIKIAKAIAATPEGELEEELKRAKAMMAAVETEVKTKRMVLCPGMPGYGVCPTCEFKYTVTSIALCPYRPAKIRRESEIREGDEKKDDDVMQEPPTYTQWTFGDFEAFIQGVEDIEDLEELYEYIDASEKLTQDEAITLRNLVKQRIDELARGYEELSKIRG